MVRPAELDFQPLRAEAALKQGDKPSYPIGSVDRALRLLVKLQEQPSISLSESADFLGVSPSTAHRLLAMLVFHGMARQDSSRQEYGPGPVLLQMGLHMLRQYAVLSRSREVIAEIAERFDETVQLSVLDGTSISYIDGIETRRALRAALRVGTSLPAHATAAGKSALAQLSIEQFRALYPSSKLPAVTKRTTRRRTELEAELELVRERGYATNMGESEDGICAVASALWTPIGVSPATISIAAPETRMNAEKLTRTGKALADTVRKREGELK